MEELKLSGRKQIKVSVGEVDYLVNKPNNKELYEFHNAQKQAPEEKSVELMTEFLAKLGLPSDVFWSLDPASTEEIVKALIPQQKKS